MSEKRAHKWITVSAVLGATVALATGLAACADGGSGEVKSNADEGIPVRIGIPSSNYWPAYIAADLDFYRKVGLEPEIVSFTSGAPLIAALESGSIDAVFTGLASLFAVHQGVDLTYLATPLDSSSQEGLVVPPGSSIGSFEDLASGMTVGAPHASCAHISALSAIDAAGLKPGDITISNLDPSVLSAALQGGDVDGVFIWGPWSIALEEEGNSMVSMDSDYQGGIGLCPTNIAVRPAAEALNPGISCRLVLAHRLALEAAAEDPTLGPAALRAELGVNQDVAQRTYDTLRIPSIDDQLTDDSPFSLTNPEVGLAKQLAGASAALTGAGVFREAMGVEQMATLIDPEPMRDATDGICAD